MTVGVGAILEVNFLGTLYGQSIVTTLHYACVIAPTQTDELLSQDDFLNLIRAGQTYDIETSYLACCSSQYTLDNLSAQYIWPTRYRKSFHFIGANGAITVAAGSPNIASFIEKTSVLAGKKNRGGIHMPAVPNTGYTAGILESTQLAHNNLLLTVMLAKVFEDSGTGRWDPIILHRTKPLNGTYVLWTDGTLQKTVRVMRRRTVGVGK